MKTLSAAVLLALGGSEAAGFPAAVELSNLNGSNGFAVRGKAADDYSGFSVSAAGDINGDGLGDLIVGAPYADPNGVYSGESYVLFGASAGFPAAVQLSELNGSNGFAVRGKAAGDSSGFSVSAAGDINGDGLDDLIIIGAPYADPNGVYSGESYVLFGTTAGFPAAVQLSDLNGSNGFAIRGKAAGDSSGFSVSAAGDINGDGLDDLVIGAPFSDPNGVYSGESYVLFGSTAGFPPAVQLSDLNGSNGFAIRGKAAGDYSGFSVSAAGDINGDGLGDFIIGADHANPNGDRSGESYVLFGSTAGFPPAVQLSDLNGSNGFAIRGKAAGDYSGFSVAAAGDINGDGLGDLIIGAPGADPNGVYSGESYLLFGSTAGFPPAVQLSDLNGSNGFAIRGKAAGDYSGFSVSAAGDINGDRLGDLIIGAPSADPNGGDSGESYVLSGTTAGFPAAVQLSDLNGSNGFAVRGAAGGDRSGYSTSSAGDINGDGLGDLVIGAPNADPNGNRSGASYVLFGRNDAPLDHFLFYQIKAVPGAETLPKFGPVHLADQFGAWDFDVSRGKHLGLPADKNNEGIGNAVTHLAEYPVNLSNKEPKQQFQPIDNVQISNQCGDFTLHVKNPGSVLLPTSIDLADKALPPDPASHNVDHFLCYDVKVQKKDAKGNALPKFPKGVQVDVTDQFQSRRYDLTKITKLCNPVDKSGNPVILNGPNKGNPFPIPPADIRNLDTHLVCYQAKPTKKFITQDGCGPLDPRDRGVPIDPPPANQAPVTVFTANQFESSQFESKSAVELCIPSTKDVPNP